MTFPVELEAVLRTRIGLAPEDNSKDALIGMAWDTAIEWAEAYTNRSLTAGDHTDEEIHYWGEAISLRAYPVKSVTSVIADGVELEKYHFDKLAGMLYFDRVRCAHTVTVSYNGGPEYKGALLMALISMFDLAYDGLDGGDITGRVRSTSIDGMRTDFAVSSNDTDMSSGLPSDVAAMLAPFRREFC